MAFLKLKESTIHDFFERSSEFIFMSSIENIDNCFASKIKKLVYLFLNGPTLNWVKLFWKGFVAFTFLSTEFCTFHQFKLSSLGYMQKIQYLNWIFLVVSNVYFNYNVIFSPSNKDNNVKRVVKRLFYITDKLLFPIFFFFFFFFVY